MNEQIENCPPFNIFMHPLLELCSEKDIRVADAAQELAARLLLSETAKGQLKQDGTKPKFVDRTHWAATYLKKAKLLVAPERGWVKITDEGISFLANYPNGFDQKELKEIDAFQKFKQPSGNKSKPIQSIQENSLIDSSELNLTPDEKISAVLQEIEDTLATELIERIYSAPPYFFERVVVELLVGMGYGNARNATVTGKSGDNGIDGVIDQDQLGLDRVYVQAKRYETHNKVGSEAIRNFAGSLNYHQATKGLFFTTSSFTSSAIETAEKVLQRIVLIDGERLAQLMIRNHVGCNPKQTFDVMRLDEDFFEY